jgi:1,4-alpha-glucan branching enzyme
VYDEDYRPAYQYGWESYSRYHGRSFDEVEEDLRRDWENARRGSRLTWENAKDAVRDAWHRVERALPGDADRDGR